MKKIVIGKTSFIKTFVNAFVHMRSMGANSNQVELVRADQVEEFLSKKTGLFVRLGKPKGWENMTVNQRKGFFGEELQKEINLTKAPIYGHYIEQTPSGTHPSAGKGLDVIENKLIFLGPSSDQSDIEIGLKTQVYEIKTTSSTMSESSLDKLVGKNKGVQQMKEKQGEHYDQVAVERAKIIVNILNEGTPSLVKEELIQATGVGFTPEPVKSNKQGPLNTNIQEFYQTPRELFQQVEEAFTDPEKSAFAQIEYGNDE